MKTLPETINTKRLLLRRLMEADADDVFRYASNPDVTRHMDWPTHKSVETSRAWIELTQADWANNVDYTWGVALRDAPERVIGAVGCSPPDFKVSFGYVLNIDHWRKGYGTEAATTLVNVLSQIDGVKRIWATCDCANEGSAKVLANAGCTLEGTFRNWSIRPNLPGAPARDDFVFAKIISS